MQNKVKLHISSVTCRADKNPYRHYGRADKETYRHDVRAYSFSQIKSHKYPNIPK